MSNGSGVADDRPSTDARMFRDRSRLWLGRVMSSTVTFLGCALASLSFLAALGIANTGRETRSSRIVLAAITVAFVGLTVWLARFTVRWFRLALIVTQSSVIVRNRRYDVSRPRQDVVAVTVDTAPIKGQFVWLRFRTGEWLMVDALGGYDNDRLRSVAAEIRDMLGLEDGQDRDRE
jgi:hypothetical protein